MASSKPSVSLRLAECQAGVAQSPEQDAFLNILKTGDILQTELAAVLKSSELSATQYNVLRILRGEGSTGLPCGRITERMLTHDPDMTRLLDRLEKRKLIERFGDKDDRRVVRAHITATGRKMLTALDEPILELHRRQLGHLGHGELKTLSGLLWRARERTPGA